MIAELGKLLALAAIDAVREEVPRLARSAVRAVARRLKGKPPEPPQPWRGKDVIHVHNTIAKGARAFPPKD